MILCTPSSDFYSITRPLIATYYGGEKGGKGNWHTTHDEDAVATQRLMTLLEWPGSDQSPATLKKMGNFAMGKRRTLEQYIPVSGVDTKHGRVIPGKHCRVNFVPWQQDAKNTAYSEYKDDEKVISSKEGTTHPLFGGAALHRKRKGKGKHRRPMRFRKTEH
jgi:hypothetical protein